MISQDDAAAWVVKLGAELDKRCPQADRLDRYRIGYPDAPDALREIKQETEYRNLLRQSVTNWPELIVGSRLDRLEVVGFNFGDKSVNDSVWDCWQRNAMDGDSGILHDAVLTNGRGFTIIWRDENGKAEIVPEHATTTIVAYSPVNSRRRVAALRRWCEDGVWNATLYTADQVWKFRGRAKDEKPTSAAGWEARQPTGEDWPLDHDLGVVPVVEYRVGRSMSRFRTNSDPLAGPETVDRQFGSAQGEFEGVIPVIDRINTVMFNGLLACAFAGFPVRALIGDPIVWQEDQAEDDGIMKDDNGDPVPMASFKPAINRFFQIENPDGKLMQLPAADLEGFIKFGDSQVQYLAAITRTPAHYLLGQMVNLSADAIRAAEAALIARITGRLHLDLGEAHEETMRIAHMIDGGELIGTENAETMWRDPENRSQAEQADAATKLKDILPWQALAERILQATPQDVAKWESMRTSEGLLGTLVAATTEVNGAPPAAPMPVPMRNGNA